MGVSLLPTDTADPKNGMVADLPAGGCAGLLWMTREALSCSGKSSRCAPATVVAVDVDAAGMGSWSISAVVVLSMAAGSLARKADSIEVCFDEWVEGCLCFFSFFSFLPMAGSEVRFSFELVTRDAFFRNLSDELL